MAKSTTAPVSQSAPAATPAERPGNGPVFSVRHRGLKAAVWRNETKKGPFFNTTVTRTYKDGNTWKESGSFGFDDLLIVAELLRACYGLISREVARQSEEAKQSQESGAA